MTLISQTPANHHNQDWGRDHHVTQRHTQGMAPDVARTIEDAMIDAWGLLERRKNTPHTRRRKILGAIKNIQPVGQKDIQQATGLSRGHVEHDLTAMVRDGTLTRRWVMVDGIKPGVRYKVWHYEVAG